MDLDLDDGQRVLTGAFAGLLGREVTPRRVREAEPLGFDQDLWEKVAAMGVPAMALPVELDGGGASLVDVALVAEEMGRSLAPVPYVEAVVAARLLARSGARVLEGSTFATVALRPLDQRQLVPAGAVAEVVVGLLGEAVVADGLGAGSLGASRPGNSSRRAVPAPPNLGSVPLAWGGSETPDRRSWTTLSSGHGAVECYATALDEWRVLTAAALVGLADGALELGVGYARERRQFGVPIGSFQAVQHRLADVATALDGARLLAREASWAMDQGLPEAPRLASMSYLFAAETAQEAAAASLHFHGGYGFMLEYDVQLYFRRAKAWSLALDDPRRELQRVADLSFGVSGDRSG